jgi:hypothetical protein
VSPKVPVVARLPTAVFKTDSSNAVTSENAPLGRPPSCGYFPGSADGAMTGLPGSADRSLTWLSVSVAGS